MGCTEIARQLTNILAEYERNMDRPENTELWEYTLELMEHLVGCADCAYTLLRLMAAEKE